MTLFVNDLSHMDVSLYCTQQGLMGASWHVDVELDGELGEDGMLFDFGEVKPWIKARLDRGADHTLLVPTEAPGVTVTECTEGLCLHADHPYPLEVRGPRQSFTLLPWKAITAERLADQLSAELTRRPPPRVDDIRLSLRSEMIEGASYRYSHGLKHHRGNCQRIAHGHRSRLVIRLDGKRAPALESHWAQWLDGRYLIDENDIVASEDGNAEERVTIRYHASQGRFHLRLPQACCAILTTPTTIEHIAAWLATRIATAEGKRCRVQVFEGIGKGAIAESES
ncbi:6-pyruvoyl trahydropterin synthase family protein [Aidingimonas lacisalsi]|uniref:6-pyruvoyl trahydropterin synthase family protein n=1 Tax=Aidingimonas lacisalsi TaxID=2604086 RepID=UPI0011D23B02|nr:6-carboxytetrahydropterin synthase [Aidingimonas lacisalsi]